MEQSLIYSVQIMLYTGGRKGSAVMLPYTPKKNK